MGAEENVETNKKRKKFATSIPGVLLILALTAGFTYGAYWGVNEANKPKAEAKNTTEQTSQSSDGKDEEAKDDAAASSDGSSAGGAVSSSGGSTSSSGSSSTSSSGSSAGSTGSSGSSQTSVQTATVREGGVRFRAGATTGSLEIAWITGGTQVTLNGPKQGDWQPVTINGKSGYINVSYLQY